MFEGGIIWRRYDTRQQPQVECFSFGSFFFLFRRKRTKGNNRLLFSISVTHRASMSPLFKEDTGGGGGLLFLGQFCANIITHYFYSYDSMLSPNYEGHIK